MLQYTVHAVTTVFERSEDHFLKKHILLTLSDQGIDGQKTVLVHLLISLKSILVFARHYEDISSLMVL